MEEIEELGENLTPSQLLMKKLSEIIEVWKRNNELREGFEFLQPDLDAGKYIGKYDEEYGGYINWDNEEVIMKDGNKYCAWKAKEITKSNEMSYDITKLLIQCVNIDDGFSWEKFDEGNADFKKVAEARNMIEEVYKKYNENGK